MVKILIIDDETVILKATSQILKHHGYDTLIADNGNKGISFCHQGPVDLVISDVIMPEKEGLEVIIELKRNFPDIKIIAMSGGGQVGDNEYLRLAQKLGADGVLSKPFTINELLNSVEVVLAGSRDMKHSGEVVRRGCLTQG